jgi:transcriptional regulator GlxA family with amidase domain
VLALDGVLDASLGAAIDVLRAADRIAVAMRRAPVFGARVVSIGKTVQLGSGMTLQTEGGLRSAGEATVVVVPGVNAITPEELDAKLGAPRAREAARWLVRAHQRGALVAAGCSAVFLLAEHGMLEDVQVTTMWALGSVFRKRYPQIALDLDATTICAGRVWTAGAALSIVDLCLALVRRFAGAAVADQCLRYLALDTRPTQARYFVLDHLARSSPELARAESWVRANLRRDFSIAELARATATSPRTFARRVKDALGTTPIRFVQRLRVEQAQHLLSTSTASLAEVAERVGYRDPSALRRVLRRETGGGARALREESRRRRARRS